MHGQPTDTLPRAVSRHVVLPACAAVDGAALPKMLHAARRITLETVDRFIKAPSPSLLHDDFHAPVLRAAVRIVRAVRLRVGSNRPALPQASRVDLRRRETAVRDQPLRDGGGATLRK